MNPWDIAAWAGAIAVTTLCIYFIASLILTISKRVKTRNTRK